MFDDFSAPFEKEIVYVIITNKHVVAGADRLRISISVMPKGVTIRTDGSAPGEGHVEVVLEEFWKWGVEHPNPDVDLCAIFVAPLVTRLPDGVQFKHRFVHSGFLLSEEEAACVRPVEPIVMVGYPNGLWDATNNRPITRQGLTASHPLISWNGERQFVIDTACFPGSSGSPVFLYEDGMYRKDDTVYAPGYRARLLGTLWGGPTVTAEGRLEVRAIPTSVQAVPVVQMMMNLGFVVHASAIIDLKQLIQARLS